MKKILFVAITFTCCFFKAYSQIPGLIVRPAGTSGPLVLDRDQNGFTSATSSGFSADDISSSELQYKIVPPLKPEPTGDLLRGPSGRYSDIVRTFDGSGFYLYNDGTNLLCRLRIGGIVSGSKGYSILLDTDGKFGPSGSYADSNYVPATNGVNGNPGFEREIVLETNFRIAVYNVDGTSNPVLLYSHPISTHSQVSIASTNDGGNEDYFYDFYVPLSELGVTPTTPLRAVATTVMAPQAAIGGPKSDIYGLDGPDYMADWTTIILSQPPFTLNSLTSSGSGPGAVCTAPPVISGSLSSSSVSVSGTWTKSPFSSVNTATIRLYNGATELGNTTVASGNTWTIPVTGLADGQEVFAKAQGAGESACLSSNTVRVNNCNNSTHSASPVITCSSIRGFEGTRASGASVMLYKLTGTGYSLYANDATTLYKVTYPTATTWRYDDINTQSGSACTGGAADVSAGTYIATATLAPDCASLPVSVCISGSAAPAQPAITSPLANDITYITGTTSANAAVNLWIDGYYIQSVIANAGGNFKFNLASPLQPGTLVRISSSLAGSCESAAYTGTVTCYMAAPVINESGAGKVAIGSQLSGTASAPAGTTISVYNSSNVLIGTATVNSSGSWTLTSPVVAASTSYYARATGTACGNSAASNSVSSATLTSSTRCGTITLPVIENATSVSGTVTSAVSGTKVILYLDGIAIGDSTINGLSWTIRVNDSVTNKIYAGGLLTIGIAESGKIEISCAVSAPVNCIAPGVPVINPLVTAITAGQFVTYTVYSSQSGILYSVRNADNTLNAGSSKFGNGGSITLQSDVFNSPGTYQLKVKATSFTGGDCFASETAQVEVTAAMPVTLTRFTGTQDGNSNLLSWTVENETDIQAYILQRSFDNISFQDIKTIRALNQSAKNVYHAADNQVRGRSAFYRLQIAEQGGRSAVSHVIYLKRNEAGMLSIYPNPFTDRILVEWNTPVTGTMQFSLTDINGKTVRTFIRNINDTGTRSLECRNLKDLPRGIYQLTLFQNQVKVQSWQVVK